MNLRFISLIILSLLFSNTQKAFAQNGQDAVTYLNAIGEQFYEISQNSMSYRSAASHGKSARKVEKRRIELLTSYKDAEATIRKMKPFSGDHALRDSIVSYLKLCRIVFNEDFGKILDLEDIAEQSYDAMEAYLLAKEKANEKLDVAFDKAKEQQTIFAEKNNIKITEGSSKLSKKLEEASKVSHYHDQVYLIFFKSYKNEVYLYDAMKRNDINALEQTKNALFASATEGLEKIGPMAAFHGDGSLKASCQQMLSHYKMEASQKMPEVINFYLKKENFDKMKAAFEAKRPSDRTQADIENINKAGKEYNASVEKYNAIMNELNKKGSTLLNNWNSTSDKFLDTHTPKYSG